MQPQEYQTLFNLEENYWWFRGQQFLLRRFLSKYYSQGKHSQAKEFQKKDLKLFDVGCGTGQNLRILQDFGTTLGGDLANEALEFCKKRGFDILKTDVMHLSLPDNSFDVVTALGVFYHKNVTDDLQGFKEIFRVLKPGGRFFIQDSAMKCLTGKHDLAFHGIRRYSRKELKEKLEKAGFLVEKVTYVNTLLFPFLYLKRKLEKLSNAPPKSEVDEDLPKWLNSLLTKLYYLELRGVSYFNYPFGINIFAVARKNQNHQ